MTHRTSHIPRRSRAFTLIEATLSIAITSILLLGMGAALTMSMSAVDSGDDSIAHANQASEQLSRLNAELSTATAISAFTANDIAFTVPDRNNDGNPEQIEYTWSGVVGAPIFRSYNGATPLKCIPGVQSCSVALADRPAAQPVQSAEQILSQCDTVSGATQRLFQTDSNNYSAQYVRPTLPAGAVSWSITRVRFFGSHTSGNSDAMHLRIRTAGAALTPTSPTLGATAFSATSLSSSAGWYEFLIGPVTGLAPTQGVCIELDGSGGSGTVNVAYLQGGSAQPFNTHFTTSANAGAAWTAPNDSQDMRFILIGTYTTMVEP